VNRLPWEAKAPIYEAMGYTPSSLQREVHKDTHETLLVSGGWRAGKSMWLATEGVPHCLVPMANPFLIALIGPTYKEPRSEFDYIVSYLADLLPKRQFDPARHVSRPKEGACELTIPPQHTQDGTVFFATVKTFTAADVESIRAFEAEGVLLCEAGGMSEEAFHNIFGRVLSTGGFIIGSGTLEASQKWYHNVIKSGIDAGDDAPWHSLILPTWANEAVFPGGRQDPKILRLEKIFPEERFRVRIGAEPIRLAGICIQGADREVNVKNLEFDPHLPVELAVDPGYAGAYAVLAIQQVGETINVIDEVYTRFLTTDQVCDIVMTKPWYKNVDPQHPGVIDRAAKQHQAHASVLERWYEKTEMWLDYVEQIIPVEDGIEQLNIFTNVGIILVSPKCEGLLAEWDLGNFPDTAHDFQPWHYRADASGVLRGDKAVTGADHSSTAFIYWLVNRFGFVRPDQLVYDTGLLTPLREGSNYNRTDILGRDQEYEAAGGLVGYGVG